MIVYNCNKDKAHEKEILNMEKDVKERQAVVKAMDIMVRCINDERIIDSWLMGGVADGDINIDTPIEEVDEYYTEDDNFKGLMTLFLKLMNRASADGLYTNGVVSGTRQVEWK